MLTIHGGEKRIVIFSQILPYFEGQDDWFRKTFKSLLANFSLEIYDSLSFSEDPKNQNITIADYSKQFLSIINQSDADVLIGFSFGGSILQNLAPSIPKHIQVFLISTPSIISNHLKTKLELLIDLLNNKETELAAQTLHHFVSKDEQAPTSLQYYDDAAVKRLLFGFRTILTHEVQTRRPNMYNLYGSLSKLISRADIFPKESANNFEIPNAGMRVFEDNSPYVTDIIEKLTT